MAWVRDPSYGVRGRGIGAASAVNSLSPRTRRGFISRHARAGGHLRLQPDEIPAFAGMTMVERREQGRGLGSFPLEHARQKALAVVDSIVACAMVLDLLVDDGAEATEQQIACAKHGLPSFPCDRRKMVLPVWVIRAKWRAQ